MANIDGTIRGAKLESREFASVGTVTTRARREVWLVTADFAAYTGSSDVARILAIGAGISSHANDGRTRTVRWAGPALAGGDANNQAVYFTGTSVQAATVSSDDITGQLSGADGTEITTTSGTTKGVAVYVGVDVP